jgi:hypothetical protein
MVRSFILHLTALLCFQRSSCWAYFRENVIRKLFVLFAIILELPENYFVERHDVSLGVSSSFKVEEILIDILDSVRQEERGSPALDDLSSVLKGAAHQAQRAIHSGTHRVRLRIEIYSSQVLTCFLIVASEPLYAASIRFSTQKP